MKWSRSEAMLAASAGGGCCGSDRSGASVGSLGDQRMLREGNGELVVITRRSFILETRVAAVSEASLSESKGTAAEI